MGALRLSHIAGLVHVAYTVAEKEKPETICSRCSCCCHFMSALVRFGMHNVVASSDCFAVNNPEKCRNCGNCVERCQFKDRTLRNDKLVFDQIRRFGCGVCVSTCPTESISIAER